MTEQRKEKRIYRPAPCLAYDVAGMEVWLSDMALEGWHLSKDGFFCGIAAFEKGTRRRTIYRLSADLEKRSWLDDTPDVDLEMAELGEQYGWEYVAKRGDFFIWRSEMPQSLELHTDPQVQAMAVNAVRKRQIGAAVSAFLWMLVYPFIKLRGGLFLAMVNLGSGFVLLGLLLALWFTVSSVIRAARLGYMGKKLMRGESLVRNANRKQDTVKYYAAGTAKWLLVILWLCLAFSRFGSAVMEEDEIPLAQYSEKPPFATLELFAGSEVEDYEAWGNDYFNTVRIWKDWLSAENYQWEENAKLRNSEGRALDGLLILEYHNAKTEWIAGKLFEEYILFAKTERKCEMIGQLQIGADSCWAYYDRIHRPTVIMRCGNKVIRASFSAYSNEVGLTLEMWTGTLADSLN